MMDGPPRRTAIVATLGPAIRNADMLRALVAAGADVFRLNFSHGDHETHRRNVALIREVEEETGRPLGILADLQGPKIRTGPTPDDGPVFIASGAQVTLTSGDDVCSAEAITVDYPHLAREIEPGMAVVINDGAIRLRVDRVDPASNAIACTALNSGSFSSRKGVNLPRVPLRIPALTQKDRADLDFIVQLDVRFIALSFVRRAADVALLKEVIGDRRSDIRIIAKIEKPEAADAVDEILAVADGIMVARGDLGVEAAAHEVPIIQKNLIRRAEAVRKPVIVATQMLESMMEHPLPTRAEASDVANAIFDGADAVMLSGETAVGAWPAEAVQMMSKIACTAEQSEYLRPIRLQDPDTTTVSSRALCDAAARASAELSHLPICVFTLSGDTAIYVSKLRTPAPVYAFSPDLQVLRILCLAGNVTAFQIPFATHIDDLVADAEQILLSRGLLHSGDRMVVVSGTTPARGAANYMQIRQVGNR